MIDRPQLQRIGEIGFLELVGQPDAIRAALCAQVRDFGVVRALQSARNGASVQFGVEDELFSVPGVNERAASYPVAAYVDGNQYAPHNDRRPGGDARHQGHGAPRRHAAAQHPQALHLIDGDLEIGAFDLAPDRAFGV